MKNTKRVLMATAVVGGAASSGCLAADAAASPVFDIPRLERRNIDADAAAWGESGFRVDLMPDKNGVVKPSADFDARFKLAWNDDGLLVLLTVRDDLVRESPDINALWAGDAFELFVARAPGAPECCHLIVSPGVDPSQPRVRIVFDTSMKAPRPAGELTAVCATRKLPDGYRAEVLFPWKDLVWTPRPGDEIGFQLMVDESDGHPGDNFYAVWFPNNNTSRDTNSMQRVRLTESNTSPPDGVGFSAVYGDFRDVRITAAAGAGAAGKRVAVKADALILGEGQMESQDGRAVAEILLPMPALGARSYPPLDILMDGRPVAKLTLPDANVVRTEAFIEERIAFTHARFTGRTFPACDFENPDLVRRLIGPYTLAVQYYDAQGKPVTAAEKVGRYAAVIEVTHGAGRPSKRFAALWRTATASAEPRVAEGSDADRQWWVDFKRKYYDVEAKYNQPFVCPHVEAGVAARVVRSGKLAEAGLRAESREKINAVCETLAAAGGVPYAVCVVRHGVVVIDKSYGDTSAQSSASTPCSIASTTKFLSAILLMELVDQGLVRLDDPAEQYVPALRGITVKRSMTVRDLYMHIAGFSGNWADDVKDLEEVIADWYPCLEVGVRHKYQGTGLALAGKIVETISGEALPCFFRKHLLDPLECAHTIAATTAAGARSTPMDLAKIGQMILNGGAYDGLRFLKPETIRQMQPVPGKDRIGPDPTVRWGIGSKIFDVDGLSPQAFGHSGANGSFLLIDPVHDLVLASTRQRDGRDYAAFRPALFKAVLAEIVDERR